MDQRWAETHFRLASIHQEYLIICQELERTSDPQYQIQLHKWATICLRELCCVLDQYKKHQLDQHPTTQHTNQ